MQDHGTKFHLPSEPSYVKQIEAMVSGMEPPLFATQGEAAGKKKGRPCKPKAKPSPKAKGTAKSKVRGKTTAAKARAKAKATATKRARAKAKAAPKARTRKTSAIGASASSQPAVEPLPPSDVVVDPRPAKRPRARKPENNDQLRVPPPHVTHNHIYSSAYRKNYALNKDRELAKQKGKEAVEFFKANGSVNSLCGKFREVPRARNSTSPKGGDLS